MARKTLILMAGAAIVLASVSPMAVAKVTPEEAAKLGAELTPLGAVKAGNADGTIPAWDGGITSPPAGYSPGDHHPDPYAGDEVLFTITGANMGEYADKLTPGHKALLETYSLNQFVLLRSLIGLVMFLALAPRFGGLGTLRTRRWQGTMRTAWRWTRC